MTIDEAIKHCVEVAEENEHLDRCVTCAKEHLQLANWLTELKKLREKNNASS